MEYQKIINLLDNTPSQPSLNLRQKIGLMTCAERTTPITKLNLKLQY